MDDFQSMEQVERVIQAIEKESSGKLSEIAKLAGLNLSEDYVGVDLSGEDLNADDLSGINLSNANLSGANFCSTNLSNANLSNADLSNANLSNADLSNANLSNADLSNADLSNADLSNANLVGANLKGTVLHRTNLRSAVVFGAKLKNTILENSFYPEEPKIFQHAYFVEVIGDAEEPKEQLEEKELIRLLAVIQKLIEELEQTNPTATKEEKQAFITLAIPPSTRHKLVNALQGGGIVALGGFADNPYIRDAITTVERWGMQ